MSDQRTIFVPITVLIALLVAGLFVSQWTGQSLDQEAGVEPIVGTASSDSANDSAFQELSDEDKEREAAILGGRFHKALRTYVDHPGVDQPDLNQIDDLDLVDATPVIGIEIEGDSIAFVMEKMVDPRAHIVNLNFAEERSVSVSYCYLADCVRVLSKESNKPIPLHVGGMDVDNQMVFLLEGERYGQSSPVLPLADYPFSRTTLGDWKASHPQSKICVPPSRASIEHRRRGAEVEVKG